MINEKKLGPWGQKISSKLKAHFLPSEFNLIDESAQHAGHSGAHEDGETHFHLMMRSKKFAGLSRIEQQRLVYKELSDELAAHIHALSLDLGA